jgi:hypothetical protein
MEHTYTKTLWDDGHGPVSANDRVKTMTDALPKALLDRLTMTQQDTNWDGRPFARRVTDGKAVVVSLNPDVLIVSVRGEAWSAPEGRGFKSRPRNTA